MNKYLELMESYKDQLDHMPLTIKDGTKKMKEDFHLNAVKTKNDTIDELKKNYNNLLEKIKIILVDRKRLLTPSKSSLDYDNLALDDAEIIKVLALENKYFTWMDKLGLKKLLSKFGAGEEIQLNEINTSIYEILQILKNAKVEVTKDDFKYSSYTYDYMTVYLGASPSEDELKQSFESIYWECPDIITHLKLNFMTIINDHEKELNAYIPVLLEELRKKLGINDKDTKLFYLEQLQSRERELDEDVYLVASKFLTKEAQPEDYVLSSIIRDNIFNKYINGESFSNLSEDDKNDFYDKIDELSHIILELDNYNFFKKFINDVKKRMEHNVKGEPTKDKIKVVEKERVNVVSKLFPQKTLFGMKEASKDENLFVLENTTIKNINTLYDELKDDVINSSVSANINEFSSILDALMLCVGNYDYFMKLFEVLKKDDETLDIEMIYSKLLHFVFSPYNEFVDNVCIKDEYDAEAVVCKKYSLLGFNLSKEDLTEDMETTKHNIDFIKTCLCFELLSLNFEDFVIINKIDKLGFEA